MRGGTTDFTHSIRALGDQAATQSIGALDDQTAVDHPPAAHGFAPLITGW